MAVSEPKVKTHNKQYSKANIKCKRKTWIVAIHFCAFVLSQRVTAVGIL